jgi:hypothetical protein
MSRERVALADEGFGREVKAALEKCKQALVDTGRATDLGKGRIRAPKDLIQRLEAIDIECAGKALAAARGRTWQPMTPGNRVAGKLVGSTQLMSGRFAMIDDGLGFSLVPWRPALEQHIGRHISGVMMTGGGIEWSLGRRVGLGRLCEKKAMPAWLKWADRRHPVKAGATRPRFAARGLDRLPSARQVPGKQLRLIGSADAPFSTRRRFQCQSCNLYRGVVH